MAKKAKQFASKITEQLSELVPAQKVAEGLGLLPGTGKKVTLQRVKGADSESITLEIDQIKQVNKSVFRGRCVVSLLSGHGIEVNGYVDEVKQKIEDAKI